MRQWINLFQTHLYHGTSMIGFCHIAHSNKLGAYGGEEQASFTLDPHIAQRFCEFSIDLCQRNQLTQYPDFFRDMTQPEGSYVAYKGEEATNELGVILVFDRAALHRDYDFKAVNFDSHGLETVDLGYCGAEKEECVFGDVDGLDRYVTGLSINRATFVHYAEFIRSHFPQDAEVEAVLRAGENWVMRFGR